MRTNMDFKKTWTKARNRGTPIIAVECADPLQVGEIICKEEAPVFAWDIVRGVYPLTDSDTSFGRFSNEAGLRKLNNVLVATGMDPTLLMEPITLLDFMRDQSPQETSDEDEDNMQNTVVLMLNAHRLLEEQAGNERGLAKVIQALYNLRDAFKTVRNTLVLLGPAFSIPSDLVNDIYVISYPLPSEEERKIILKDLSSAFDSKITDDEIDKTVSATRGLTPFATEQAAALSLTKSGIDISTVRNWWKKSIDSQKGLSVVQANTTLDDIAGLDNFKRFAKMVVGAKDGPEAIVWIDEIEKALAGSAGDNTGVTQDILGQLLTHMQETNADGLIAAGGPGTGKSLSSVALGSIKTLPVISLDIGGLKGGVVGESEKNVRAALKTIKALAGRTFWIASCNALSGIRPELKRRFTYGIWYFDLPEEIEGLALWKMYTKKYNITGQPIPKDVKEWTGAEIHVACRTAARLNISLQEAAQWIVPVRETARAEIAALREQANGKYTSATYPGPYTVRGVPKKGKMMRSGALNEEI